MGWWQKSFDIINLFVQWFPFHSQLIKHGYQLTKSSLCLAFCELFCECSVWFFFQTLNMKWWVECWVWSLYQCNIQDYQTRSSYWRSQEPQRRQRNGWNNRLVPPLISVAYESNMCFVPMTGIHRISLLTNWWDSSAFSFQQVLCPNVLYGFEHQLVSTCNNNKA